MLSRGLFIVVFGTCMLSAYLCSGEEAFVVKVLRKPDAKNEVSQWPIAFNLKSNLAIISYDEPFSKLPVLNQVGETAKSVFIKKQQGLIGVQFGDATLRKSPSATRFKVGEKVKLVTSSLNGKHVGANAIISRIEVTKSGPVFYVDHSLAYIIKSGLVLNANGKCIAVISSKAERCMSISVLREIFSQQ